MKNNSSKTVYYYEIPLSKNSDEVFLTFNKKEAEGKQGFRIANIDDMSSELACGEPIREGYFKIWDEETETFITVTYYEKWDKNELDEDILVDCGYKLM